jgi:hypothetical protein
MFNSNVTACKALDDLIDMRLFREENQTWIEKAVITQLQELFDAIARNWKNHLSAPATHAAQTVSCSYLSVSGFSR